MDVVALFAVSVAVGFAIGILSGLLGIGGGTVMVPVFRLAFGLDAIASTATSLFAIIPTSISGAVSHIKNKTCVLALGVAVGLGGACTSPLGVYLASVSPDLLVMAVAAAVIGYAAVSMFRKATRAARQQKRDAGAGAGAKGGDAAGEGAVSGGVAVAAAGNGPVAAGASSGVGAARSEALSEALDAPSRRELAIAFGIGLLAGAASGYVGVGGGFLIVPLLVSFTRLSMRKASGTSLIAVMILAIPGTIEQGVLGNIDYVAGLAISVGSIPGAVVGARLVKRVPEQRLRILFGCVLIVAAILLVVNELGMLG